jgi:predicted TIM-barrel fold metal-dependent hydrolase
MIDGHAHLFHPRWYPAAFQQALVRDFQRRRKASPDSAAGASAARQLLQLLTDDTGRRSLDLMDRTGIEKRVILVLDWGVELGEAELSIRDIHREILGVCRGSGGRLTGFAGIDPRRTDARDIVRHAFDDLGARGLKLHPTGGWTLLEERTIAVVELAAERALPVLVHLGKTVDVLSAENAQPEAFVRLAERFPGIPFIAGHSAFDLWERFTEMAAVPANVLFDISGWQERVRGDGANIIADLSRLHDAFPGRVCFGTDSPFYSFNLLLAEKQWIERVVPPFAGRWAALGDSL